MVTIHIIEATHRHGGFDPEQFEDSVYRRYRFVTGDSDTSAKAIKKFDDNLDTDNISDDVFVTSKPLYVCAVHSDNDRNKHIVCNAGLGVCILLTDFWDVIALLVCML